MDSFEKIVAPLLRTLKIEASKIQEDQVFIELEGGLRVNMLCNWEGSVILMANVGGIKQASLELLWSLLERNLFCELPQVQISASAQDKKIILWVQERLSLLDSSSLHRLFERFVRTAKDVGVMLESKTPAPPKPGIGPSGLTKSRLGAYSV